MLPILILSAVQAPALQQTATANVAAFRKAILAKDIGYFERTFAPEYTQSSDKNRIDRATALKRLKAGLMKAPIRSLDAKVLSVKPDGKGFLATASFRGTMDASIQGHKAALIATWKDDQRWTPVKGRWTLRSTHTYGFERVIE